LNRYRNNLRGTITERLFYSPSLGKTEPYDLYLPPGYEQDTRRYPVLYMLHGGGGHRDEWLGYGLIDVADPAIAEGKLQPMIIVFPQGDDGYWANNAGGGPRWADYLWRDVVNHIDSAYRTLRSPAARAVGGISMGAWGALSGGFLHPDVFGVIGSHSASLPSDDGFRPVLGTGDEFKQKDPVTLAATAPGLAGLKIWIDVAIQDEWLPRNNELHHALADRNIPHVWQINPGVHDYTYWMQHTMDYLTFYSSALAGP
jgi:enterochelin esterase-like enzyme